ncbi:hypothetical protein EXW61_17010 [Bacillus mycoides]|nr:hypothetical protein C174_11472 [Bacillus mycoides FSL H7-687]QWG85077.1 hypothetical protein EXW61_17010 [Bacillus mycoides]QWI10728.1 hypothetical protein EXW47_10055 [Bacillus mycoides]QWI55155.1 hypothetical protein EXW42_13670 [Bacillus mycoides]QWI60137.1 hypothetical protein EXW57_10130 [Bacillus mycoides]
MKIVKQELHHKAFKNKSGKSKKQKIPKEIGIYISAYSSLEKDILSLTYRTTYICEIDVKVM